MKTPSRHPLDEPDIGSGERSPSQHDTDLMIAQVPSPLPRPTSPTSPTTPASEPIAPSADSH